ncbi:MAG: Cell division protein FtsI [Peptidoglycan synthetase] [Candidatus Bipolaricaulis sibiricus]|uniref:Cell division protein FtsI [Peptidoglycan synthetase] n=1 Tax=Bipolaricaulis sibiricus TaxID=2501609 RepID=A0A410FUU4_BIPS1|nr:MAG: Cell division protein FtsI [Peptidoglycan synthetase] [Candidatus Bipolaricaulis sibiricus]
MVAEREMQVGAEMETRKGVYSNLAVISHQPDEFFIDFLLVDPQAQTPERGQAILVSRVILSPRHMKRLYEAIGENIEKYEKNLGKIVIPPKLG